MCSVTCKPNQPLVLIDGTRTESIFFLQDYLQPVLHIHDSACCHLQTEKLNTYLHVCMDTPVALLYWHVKPRFQHFRAPHYPHLSDF